MPPIYKRQFEGVSGQPIGVSPQALQGGTDITRNIADKSQQLAFNQMERSKRIASNNFVVQSNNMINDAYSRNSSNPEALQKELSEIKQGLTKNIFSREQKQQLEMKFDMKAGASISEAQKTFSKQQIEQDKVSSLNTVDSTLNFLENNSGLLYSDNPQDVAEYGTSLFNGIDDIFNASTIKDANGNNLFTPIQINNMQKDGVSRILSSGAKNHFDKLAPEQRAEFYQKYLNKTLSIPWMDEQGGIVQKSPFDMMGRSDHDRILKYMENYFVNFEKAQKEGTSLYKKSAEFALKRTDATESLNNDLVNFGVSNKNDIAKSDVGTLENIMEYYNKIDDAVSNDLISVSNANSFRKTILKSWNKAVDKRRVSGDSWAMLNDNDSVFVNGVEELDEYLEKQNIKDDDIKGKYYKNYYNKIVELGSDPKAMARKTDFNVSEAVSSVIEAGVNQQSPLSSKYYKNPTDIILDGFGKHEIRVDSKAPVEASIKTDREIFEDANGNKAYAIKDENGNITGYEEIVNGI